MGYTMKHGNKKKSYSDIFNESNQAMTDATEAEREASIEEQKADGPPYKKDAPTKAWGAIIGAATDVLKSDTKALETANNRNISAASIQRR